MQSNANLGIDFKCKDTVEVDVAPAILEKVFTLHVTTLLLKVEASWNQLLFNLSSHVVFHY